MSAVDTRLLTQLLLALTLVAYSMSLTVELPARGELCFYHTVTDALNNDTELSLNSDNLTMIFFYRVVSSGEYNTISVLVRHLNPNTMLHDGYERQEINKQYGVFKIPYQNGLYECCFSNNIDVFSRKTVAFQFSLPSVMHSKVMHIPSPTGTAPSPDILLLKSAYTISANMRNMSDGIRMDRYKNFQAFRHSLNLNARVSFWSPVVLIGTLLTGVGQVLAVRRLFQQPKTGGQSLLCSKT